MGVREHRLRSEWPGRLVLAPRIQSLGVIAFAGDVAMTASSPAGSTTGAAVGFAFDRGGSDWRTAHCGWMPERE